MPEPITGKYDFDADARMAQTVANGPRYAPLRLEEVTPRAWSRCRSSAPRSPSPTAAPSPTSASSPCAIRACSRARWYSASSWRRARFRARS
ncbi:hypothetical protein ACFSLT_10555 [Novosphingobium resinovorum]